MIYQFEVFGTVEDKELSRFARFVEGKYEKLTGETFIIQYNGIVAVATLTTTKRMIPEKLEKCRFLLENEFSKRFQNVKVIVKEKRGKNV